MVAYRVGFATGVLMVLAAGCNTASVVQSSSAPVATKTLSVSAPIAQTTLSASSNLPAEVFRKVLPQLKQVTGVPILLPSKLPYLGETLYANAIGDRNSYTIRLSATPHCTANACFVGEFRAKRGESSTFEQTIFLANGIQGYYHPLSCGGSCSPPAIAWAEKGVLYEMQLSLPTRDREIAKHTLIQIANSAIETEAR